MVNANDARICSLDRRNNVMDDRAVGKNRVRLHPQTRRNHSRVTRMKAKLRIVSNIGLIIGQCVLLFASRDIGLLILLISSSLSVPFFLQEKMWDVLMLMAFCSVVNFIGLFVK